MKYFLVTLDKITLNADNVTVNVMCSDGPRVRLGLWSKICLVLRVRVETKVRVGTRVRAMVRLELWL